MRHILLCHNDWVVKGRTLSFDDFDLRVQGIVRKMMDPNYRGLDGRVDYPVETYCEGGGWIVKMPPVGDIIYYVVVILPESFMSFNILDQAELFLHWVPSGDVSTYEVR